MSLFFSNSSCVLYYFALTSFSGPNYNGQYNLRNPPTVTDEDVFLCVTLAVSLSTIFMVFVSPNSYIYIIFDLFR